MEIKRLWHTIRLQTIRSAVKRAQYLREKHVFYSMGKHCSFMPRRVPLYSRLIRFGDYVIVASNVAFHTHDAVHSAIGVNNESLPESIRNCRFKESMGCIDIGNHVYIAAGAAIEHGVKIGDNVIVSSRSVVCNDIPSDSIVRGNPAKIVCSLSQYLTIRAAKKTYPDELNRKGASISKELEEWLWNDFNNNRK